MLLLDYDNSKMHIYLFLLHRMMTRNVLYISICSRPTFTQHLTLQMKTEMNKRRNKAVHSFRVLEISFLHI